MSRTAFNVRLLPGKAKIDGVDVGYDDTGAILSPGHSYSKLLGIDFGTAPYDVLELGFEWEIRCVLLQTDAVSLAAVFAGLVSAAGVVGWPRVTAPTTPGSLWSGATKSFVYTPDGDNYQIRASNAAIFIDNGAEILLHPERVTAYPILVIPIPTVVGALALEYGPL